MAPDWGLIYPAVGVARLSVVHRRVVRGDGWPGAARRPTLKVMTVWSMLEECISQLDEPFRRSEIISWFRRHHPGVNESTLAAHIQAATANAANRAQNNPLGRRPPLL